MRRRNPSPTRCQLCELFILFTGLTRPVSRTPDCPSGDGPFPSQLGIARSGRPRSRTRCYFGCARERRPTGPRAGPSRPCSPQRSSHWLGCPPYCPLAGDSRTALESPCCGISLSRVIWLTYESSGAKPHRARGMGFGYP